MILLLLAIAWVGHAYIWTAVLNYVYARPYPKAMLKPWRHFTGLLILSFPLIPLSHYILNDPITPEVVNVYLAFCVLFGGIVFPLITIWRLLRKPVSCIVFETTDTLDLWAKLGPAAIGDGKGRLAARLPFNCIYRVDFTELTLSVPDLPQKLEGLTILHLTDVHYHGTPSRAFHERVIEETLKRWPTSDLVCLTGDYVDTDEHHTWIRPLLGSLKGVEGVFAILGNHDLLHNPDQVRQSLAEAGARVIGNGGIIAPVRGVPCLIAGQEGPWFRPTPDLVSLPETVFRIGLSHTPDYFRWGQRSRLQLLLCGHVHGGQLRMPIIGSIFVPSVYGRRYDMGVFESGGTIMVVGRGLSGKEPLRFRCHPQVIRITLTRRG